LRLRTATERFHPVQNLRLAGGLRADLCGGVPDVERAVATRVQVLARLPHRNVHEARALLIDVGCVADEAPVLRERGHNLMLKQPFDFFDLLG
jgi:hypothetical protein